MKYIEPTMEIWYWEREISTIIIHDSTTDGVPVPYSDDVSQQENSPIW